MSIAQLDLEILQVRPPKGMTEKRTPLVFLHGAFAGAWCWVDRFLPYFAIRGYRCLAPSFRGHGGSDGSRTLDQYGISDFVSDVASVAEDLPEPPVLIGHSMGGFVAMKYAEVAPVSGLALLSSVPPAGLAGPSLSLALFNPLLLFEIGMAQTGNRDALTLEGLKTALFSNRVSDDLVAKYLPMMGGESVRAVAEMHGAVMAKPEKLKGKMPTLVLGAKEDGLIPPAYTRATARLLGVEAVILEEAGHGMMLDDSWERASQAIVRWLNANDI